MRLSSASCRSSALAQNASLTRLLSQKYHQMSIWRRAAEKRHHLSIDGRLRRPSRRSHYSPRRASISARVSCCAVACHPLTYHEVSRPGAEARTLPRIAPLLSGWAASHRRLRRSISSSSTSILRPFAADSPRRSECAGASARRFRLPAAGTPPRRRPPARPMLSHDFEADIFMLR